MPQFIIWFFISQRGDSYMTVFCWSLIWRGTSVPRRFTVQSVTAEIFTLMTRREKAAGRRGSSSHTSAALVMQQLLCSSSSFIPRMWRAIPYSGFLHRWSHWTRRMSRGSQQKTIRRHVPSLNLVCLWAHEAGVTLDFNIIRNVLVGLMFVCLQLSFVPTADLKTHLKYVVSLSSSKAQLFPQIWRNNVIMWISKG